ncbi:MAG: fimbria/pilus outer membrane usher protein [Alphaproteobacteria bacterium]|nr:fimbria/pilus outer membrane usher protein [Alphaproteobacteria bacterium]
MHPRKDRGRRRALLAAALLCLTAATVAAEPAPGEQKVAQNVRVFNVTLPLIFQGYYLGDVPVLATADGKVSVDIERFIALLGQRLSPKMIEDLKRVAGADRIVPIEALATVGLAIEYDAAKLELRVSIPLDQQGGQSVTTYDRSRYGAPRPGTIAPADCSASLTLSVRQTYYWEPDALEGWGPLRVAADLAANAFGQDGVYLFAQGEYDDGADTAFRRGNAVLIHDDPETAIRYSAGDVLLIPAGFQGAPVIGGVAVERRYGELQPFTNIRPSGLYRFTLDRTATVEVVVNGATIRTLRLDAGQYDLRDFPLFNGLNDVNLYVVDEFGRRLIASFSLFYSTRLLNPGITEFGATAGYLQRRKPDGEITYREELPTFSGYIRHGLTEEITVGANLQANEFQWLSGLEVGWGTPVGTFGFLAGWSDVDGESGHSFLASYEFSADEAWIFEHPQLNFEYVTTSEFFVPLEDLTLQTPKEYELRGRASARLPYDVGIGISASFAKGRDIDPDERRYALSVSRNLDFVNVTASHERIEIEDEPDEDRFLLTLSLPLSDNEMGRASYDSRNDLAELEYTRFQSEEVGDVGIRSSIARDNDRFAGAGELSYNANRAALTISHDAVSDSAMSEITSQQTSYNVATQIAFAGDDVAWGRPVGPRFAIVSAHDTLDGHEVGVKEGTVRGTRQAVADDLGPALVRVGSAYQPQTVMVDVENLPEGYDFGTGQYDLFAGPASGYAIQVGSDASHVIRGVLVDRNGKAMTLLGGEIRSLSDPTFKPVLVFTNSAGRFIAEGLAPGKYEMVLGPALDVVVPLEVPDGAKGIVDVGNVKPKGEGT